MTSVPASLERIAGALEKIAETLGSGSERMMSEMEARNRRKRRFALAIEQDKRYPGLLVKVLSANLTLVDHVLDVVMNCSDAVAVTNYLVDDGDLCKRLAAMEPEDVKQELARIEQRLCMKAI